ncbi:MAG: cytochrome c oxidase assembly protein [Pseudomonadota bacterium]|nr:cytochrome c oxidase assembly protein [Pseudomonadota bacterium]
MARSLAKRNRSIALIAFLSAAGMGGASYAAVPLYEIFCQVTGYGGTTQVAEVAPDEVLKRKMIIRFNADTDQALPWKFAPTQAKTEVLVGENAIAFYRARNLSDRAIVGMATFNVTPLKAGQYFNKIECFCFAEQRLEPGGEVDMPVSFFVDPAISEDPNLNDVKAITLSYTFYQTKADTERTARAEDAVQKTDG